jgi:hypothetical protein
MCQEIKIAVFLTREVFPMLHLPKDNLWLLSAFILEKSNIRARDIVSNRMIRIRHIKEPGNIIEMFLNTNIGGSNSVKDGTNRRGLHNM